MLAPNSPALRVLQALARETDEVLVGFSGGKDSVVLLDLCCSGLFRRVECYFQYLVPDLAFQQDYMLEIAHKYRVTIHQRPHWMLSRLFRGSFHRPPTPPAAGMRDVSVTESEESLRYDTGIQWIATGDRASESLQRRGMLSVTGGLDRKRLRVYPLAWWPVAEVRAYIAARNLKVSPESQHLKRSLGFMGPEEYAAIKRFWPEDYQRLLLRFPFLEAEVFRHEREQRDAEAASAAKPQVPRARKRRAADPAASSPAEP